MNIQRLVILAVYRGRLSHVFHAGADAAALVVAYPKDSIGSLRSGVRPLPNNHCHCTPEYADDSLLSGVDRRFAACQSPACPGGRSRHSSRRAGRACRSCSTARTSPAGTAIPRLWTVKDGVIHGETTAENPAKGNTFLIWKDGTLKDFELRLSFRCNATNNSGIQYRSKHITDGKSRNKWVVRGYQHELRNETKLPNTSGFIYDEGGKRGRICLVGEKATWETDGKKVVSERR